MKYTPNYNLKKPEPTDNYNVENDNDNMDIIDAQLNLNSTNVQQVTTELNTHMAEKASDTQYGHMKVGTGLNATDGVVNADVRSVAGKTGDVTLTKSDVGLANVENANIASIRTSSTNKLRAEVRSSAPTSPANGDIWYDSANHRFRGRANGAWV